MKRLALSVLCLCLVFMAAAPRPAAAHCHENCCSDMQQSAESACSYSYVRSFYCVEGYGGSCCAAWWDCAPPWQ